MYFILPYYVVQLAIYAWLNHQSRSALLSDIYSLVLTFPLALTVIQVMLNPFSKGFSVTPKGTVSDRFSFNWNLAFPLIGLFVVTAVSLWRNLGMCMVKGAWMADVPPEIAQQAKGVGLGWLWSAYNLVMIGIALLILLDVPKPDLYDWFDLRRTVRLSFFQPKHSQTATQPLQKALQTANQRSDVGNGGWLREASAHVASLHPPSPIPHPTALWGSTTMMSEGGIEIALTQAGFPTLAPGETLPVTLEIMEENLTMQGTAIGNGIDAEFPTVRVMFDELNLQQQRRLVETLFCRPGQWRRHKTPNEFHSLLLLGRILLKPRVLFDREAGVRAIAVAKG